MMESFMKVSFREKVNFIGLIKKSMMVNGQMIKNMGKGNIYILMVEFMKGILWKIFLMGLEY